MYSANISRTFQQLEHNSHHLHDLLFHCHNLQQLGDHCHNLNHIGDHYHNKHDFVVHCHNLSTQNTTVPTSMTLGSIVTTSSSQETNGTTFGCTVGASSTYGTTVTTSSTYVNTVMTFRHMDREFDNCQIQEGQKEELSGFSLCLNEKTGFVGQKHKHDFHSFHNVMAFLLILDHKQENKKEPKDNFYKRHFSVAAKDKNIYYGDAKG